LNITRAVSVHIKSDLYNEVVVLNALRESKDLRPLNHYFLGWPHFPATVNIAAL